MFAVTEPTTPQQLEKIFSLRYAILRAPWGQPKGSERDNGEHTAIHAMIEDEQGNCIAAGRLQFNSPDEAQIRYMVVNEIYRGQKLGRQILHYLEEKARQHHCRRIMLQAREKAVPFYLANGYVIEEKTFFLFDAIQHYRMSKVVR